MRGKLIINLLSVRSNFIDNIEEPATDHPETDTDQWWIGPKHSFMIHTFALNRDIRVWMVDTKPNIEEIAQQISAKNYGDVITETITITCDNWLEPTEVGQAFAGTGLEPRIEITEHGFLYWKPAAADYQAISSPEGT